MPRQTDTIYAGQRGARGSQGAGILNVKLKGKNPDNTKIVLGKLAEVYLETAQRQRQQRLRRQQQRTQNGLQHGQ